MRRELKKRLREPMIFRLRIISASLVILALILCLPWSMFSSGLGRVTALNPNERLQEITAPVGGFVDKWFVKEGSRVKAGDVLLEIVDNDPSYFQRLQTELEAARAGVEGARLALTTGEINLERQRKLFQEGLSSRKDYEKARIDVAKLSMELAKATAVVTKAETQVSRQTTQTVQAPQDGTVLRVTHGEGNFLYQPGDTLLVFAPELKSIAVETWHQGNDLRFLQKGQIARIQFEGWPAAQIPGWPSVAIGTFKAKVALVDYASSLNGKFRVILVPAEPWPSDHFLKLNATARSIISLGDTIVAREIWRKLNDFPPATEPMRDELNQMFAKKSKFAEDPQEKTQDRSGKAKKSDSDKSQQSEK